MKTKITTIGILLCVVAACNVSNSNKKEPFDPHSLNGLYSDNYMTYYQIPDSLCVDQRCVGRHFYTGYISVNYPLFHVCIVASNADPPEPLWKEEVKVAREKENLYKVKETNSHMVNNNNVSYKIIGDSTHHKDKITYYLSFNKIERGNEYYGSSFQHDSDEELNKEYQRCLRSATDTTGIFPSTQKYKVKPK